MANHSYTNMYATLPQDIRPQGAYNLNQLVSNQLGSSSFDVVACIHGNLLWLHQLHENLARSVPFQVLLQTHSNVLTEITRHMKELWCISASMPALQIIASNIETIVKNVEVLSDVDIKLKSTEIRIAELKEILSKTNIEELIKQNNELVTKLEVAAKALDISKTYINNMAHYAATDAVTMAMFTKLKPESDKALEAIKASELLGNDETINKDRLESA